MSEETRTWLVPTLIALAGAAALWYFQMREPPAEPPAAPAASAVEPQNAAPAGPRYPVPAASVAPPAGAANDDLTPLPALDDSDAYFELAMVAIFGSGIDELLVDEALIEKIVATIDSVPGPRIAERVRPIGRLPGSFAVDGQDDSGEFRPNPANYARYDFLVNLLATADVDELAATYRRFYPLFQEAYANLGYPDAYFNDRLVDVIDHLLETPSVDGLPELSRPNVLYEFADPALESLSGGQKALLRAGPDHGVRIRQFLEEFRDAIA